MKATSVDFWNPPKPAFDIYDWHKSLNYSIRCIKDVNTGMGEVRNPAIHVYPNPAFDHFTISIPAENEEGIATLFDSMGRMVAENAIPDFTNYLFDIDGLAPGTFLLRIRTALFSLITYLKI